ncbi:hypothetical protein [Enterococcus alishanensis]
MITEVETNKYRHGALHTVEPKKRVKKKGKIEVGKKYICKPRKDCKWTHPFFGIVEQIYKNSALVIITATDEVDDYLTVEHKGKTVVPLKNMVELD